MSGQPTDTLKLAQGRPGRGHVLFDVGQDVVSCPASNGTSAQPTPKPCLHLYRPPAMTCQRAALSCVLAAPSAPRPHGPRPASSRPLWARFLSFGECFIRTRCGSTDVPGKQKRAPQGRWPWALSACCPADGLCPAICRAGEHQDRPAVSRSITLHSAGGGDGRGNLLATRYGVIQGKGPALP